MKSLLFKLLSGMCILTHTHYALVTPIIIYDSTQRSETNGKEICHQDTQSGGVLLNKEGRCWTQADKLTRESYCEVADPFISSRIKFYEKLLCDFSSVIPEILYLDSTGNLSLKRSIKNYTNLCKTIHGDIIKPSIIDEGSGPDIETILRSIDGKIQSSTLQKQTEVGQNNAFGVAKSFSKDGTMTLKDKIGSNCNNTQCDEASEKRETNEKKPGSSSPDLKFGVEGKNISERRICFNLKEKSDFEINKVDSNKLYSEFNNLLQYKSTLIPTCPFSVSSRLDESIDQNFSINKNFGRLRKRSEDINENIEVNPKVSNSAPFDVCKHVSEGPRESEGWDDSKVLGSVKGRRSIFGSFIGKSTQQVVHKKICSKQKASKKAIRKEDDHIDQADWKTKYNSTYYKPSRSNFTDTWPGVVGYKWEKRNRSDETEVSNAENNKTVELRSTECDIKQGLTDSLEPLVSNEATESLLGVQNHSGKRYPTTRTENESQSHEEENTVVDNTTALAKSPTRRPVLGIFVGQFPTSYYDYLPPIIAHPKPTGLSLVPIGPFGFGDSNHPIFFYTPAIIPTGLKEETVDLGGIKSAEKMSVVTTKKPSQATTVLSEERRLTFGPTTTQPPSLSSSSFARATTSAQITKGVQDERGVPQVSGFEPGRTPDFPIQLAPGPVDSVVGAVQYRGSSTQCPLLDPIADRHDEYNDYLRRLQMQMNPLYSGSYSGLAAFSPWYNKTFPWS